MEILSDIDYGLLITTIGCILAVVAIWQAFKYKTQKKLEFQTWTKESLVKLDDNLGELTLTFKKKKINEIIKLEFYFKNEGNTPLTINEIVEPIIIKFARQIKVLEAKIYSTERSNKYDIEINQDEIKILSNFIEIGEVFKIVIKIADFSDNVPSISYKVIGGINFSRRLSEDPMAEISLAISKFGSDMIVYLLLFLGLFHLQLFLFIKTLKLNDSNMQFIDTLINEILEMNLTFDVVFSIFSLILFTIFPLVLCKKYYNLSKPYYLHMKQIDNWILK